MNKAKRALLLLWTLLALGACLLLPFRLGRALGAFVPAEDGVPVPVLMYHSVVESAAYAGQYAVTRAALAGDLAALRERGYTFVSCAQLIDFCHGRGDLPEKPLLLTFDDGYLNNLRFLPELLEEYDGYALVAAVGEFCDIYQTAGDDGSPHCGMSWDALAEAAASPRLEVANHSYYFHHMGARPGTGQKDGESKRDWSAAFASDISRMQDAVREHCGLTPQSFTYPFGQETAGADAILKDLGIQASFNSREEVARLRRGHPEDLYSIGRFCRDGRISTEAFLARWEQSAGG